jgi:two-component system, LytTR family, response regulator
MNLRILVVDDEPLARARVVNLLAGETGVSEIRECENGLEAVQAIEQWQPDLVFLDVQMPGLDGFGVVDRIGPDRMPVTVFATAFDEFAIRAFEAHALDYLLKPFDPERLAQALGRARTQVVLRQRGELEEKLSALLEGSGNAARYTERFVIRNGARITFVEAERVEWIGAEGNYVGLHVGKQVHLIRETLTELERKLDPTRFLRIHRSTIINLDQVQAVESLFRGEYVVILKAGRKLNSSSSYREKLEEALLAG